MRKTTLVSVSVLVLVSAACFAQEAPNPFTAHNTKPPSGFVADVTSAVFSMVFNVMAPIQRSLNENMAHMTRALETSRSLGGLLLVVAFALAYGIFHAAGPGHGKTIVSSFFLANESKVHHSFIVGYLVAAVHALSALTVVLVLYYIIRGIFATGAEQAQHYIQLVTFAIIMVIGGFMLVRRATGHGHAHFYAHGEDDEHDHPGLRGLSLRNLLGIAVPAGLIPCPGAVAVILFALSLHMLAVSILAVSSISLGMGTTISATGAIVILVKKGAIRAVTGASDERESKFRSVVEIGGAAILFLFGLVLFLAQV